MKATNQPCSESNKSTGINHVHQPCCEKHKLMQCHKITFSKPPCSICVFLQTLMKINILDFPQKLWCVWFLFLSETPVEDFAIKKYLIKYSNAFTVWLCIYLLRDVIVHSCKKATCYRLHLSCFAETELIMCLTSVSVNISTWYYQSFEGLSASQGSHHPARHSLTQQSIISFMLDCKNIEERV